MLKAPTKKPNKNNNIDAHQFTDIAFATFAGASNNSATNRK